MKIPWHKIKKTKTCWNWTETLYKGYGQIKSEGKTRRAHRIIYQLLVGKIPKGLDLDHLCRNKKCVNPKHLEPVTRSENVKRALPFRKLKKYCKYGHRFLKANIYFKKNKPNWRQCKTCYEIFKEKIRSKK